MTPSAASTSPLVRRYTLEEFFALDPPEGGGHWELIAGVLYMVPPPEWPHNLSGSKLNLTFAVYAAAHAEECMLFVPRTPIWIDETQVRGARFRRGARRPKGGGLGTYLEPDLFLISRRRLAEMDRRRITSADLVVEIYSPGSSVYDRTAKADTYAALGVAELWLIDPEDRTVEQRVLERDGSWEVVGEFADADVVRSRAFPGLEMTAASAFE